MKITCRSCGHTSDLVEKTGFGDTCPSCHAWLHSCVQCRFYQGGRCTEPSAERVGDPEGRNYCDWFVAAAGDDGHGDEKASRSEAEEMWRRLTKK